MNSHLPALQIRSEIGPLKKVLLHRPGKELEQLIPKYLDEMLFEDIPYLARMQEEHDRFAQVLRELGAEVFYFEELLTEILVDPEVRRSIIDTLAGRLRITSEGLRGDIRALLEQKGPGELTAALLEGLAKEETETLGRVKRLSYYIKDTYPFYIDPLPNLYFSRDYGTVIGNRLSVNSMHAAARQRESMLLQYIAEHHPLFGMHQEMPEQKALWYRYNEASSIEGGDILVLGEKALLIGCSARTSAEGIEVLAERLFAAGTVQKVLVIQIPFVRAYMHLDTVFTMVDHDKFTIYPGINGMIKIFSLRPGKSGIIIRQEADLSRSLARLLGLPSVKLIETGGGNPLTAEREQWNDSTNTLAVAPGKVITYRRNIVSNEILRKNGIEVVEIAGSELVRGRGGPRCMSMPLFRE